MSNSEVEMNLDGMVSCVYVNVVTHVVSEDVVIQIVTGNFSHIAPPTTCSGDGCVVWTFRRFLPSQITTVPSSSVH